ncbi:MAG TPA: hypothetical protein VF178_06515 [Gemmatimonadaceae bacterium]
MMRPDGLPAIRLREHQIILEHLGDDSIHASRAALAGKPIARDTNLYGAIHHDSWGKVVWRSYRCEVAGVMDD